MGDFDFGLILSGVDDSNRPDADTVYDVLILGGGPASLTSCIYTARKLMTTAVVTKDIGGQVAWTSSVENYTGFKFIEGQQLVDKFEEQVTQFDEIKIANNSTITGLKKENDIFYASTEGGPTFKGKTVIITTGKRNRPLNVPGEQEYMGRGVAVCAICDAPLYRGKIAAVVGGGNSGAEAALDLSKVATQVTVITRASDWTADQIIVDRLREIENVRLIPNMVIKEIKGNGKSVTEVLIHDIKGENPETIPTQGLFVEVGLIPNSEPFADFVKLNQWGEIEIDSLTRTSVEGCFAAGDVTDVPYKQIVISAGEGAKAGLAAYDYLISKGQI